MDTVTPALYPIQMHLMSSVMWFFWLKLCIIYVIFFWFAVE